MTVSATQTILRQIRENGLPEPTGELEFHDDRKWRFDLAWPEIKLYFEIEGGAFVRGRHVRPKGYEGDIEKYNQATLDGWTGLRATTKQVMDGKAIEWLIKAIVGTNSA